jgi:acyl dehydratase
VEIMDVDIEEMRAQFLNQEFDEVKFEIDGDRFAAYAKACGELDPRFTDPSHENFQAPPTFVSTLVGGRMLPGNFPRPKGVGMDAGKSVEWMAPIRAGVTLTGKSHLHDIYTKTGRSGRMIFLVTRMELYDEDLTHVANADTRTVIREKAND